MPWIHFVQLVRGEVQTQCLTHPAAVPELARYEQWPKAAVTVVLRPFGKT